MSLRARFCGRFCCRFCGLNYGGFVRLNYGVSVRLNDGVFAVTTACGWLTCRGGRGRCCIWMGTSAVACIPPLFFCNIIIPPLFFCNIIIPPLFFCNIMRMYVGMMKEGQHEGQGTMFYHNGDMYAGDV